MDVLELENKETEVVIEYAFGLVPRVYGLVLDALNVFSGARSLLDEAKIILSGGQEGIVTLAEKAKVSRLPELLQTAA